MFTQFLQRLFSSDAVKKENIEERQLKELREYEASEIHTATDDKHKAVPTHATTSMPPTSPYASDIAILERTYGSLHDGMEINLTLHQALEIMPRTRKKADAYKGLKSELKRLYGVTFSVGGNNNNATNNNGKI